MRKLLLISAFAIAGCSHLHPAEADTVTVSWENPTENVPECNNATPKVCQPATPIPATGEGSLTKATLVYGTCNTAGTAIAVVKATIDVPMPATSKITNMPGGVNCVHATVSNTYGETSDPSNVVAHTAPFSKPGPARSLKVIKSS